MENFKQFDILKQEAKGIKISIRDLTNLDPESKEGNGDFASLIYLFTKAPNLKTLHTKDQLLKKLVETESITSPELIARVEKTIDNFINKGLLKNNGDGHFFADFEVII